MEETVLNGGLREVVNKVGGHDAWYLSTLMCFVVTFVSFYLKKMYFILFADNYMNSKLSLWFPAFRAA